MVSLKNFPTLSLITIIITVFPISAYTTKFKYYYNCFNKAALYGFVTKVTKIFLKNCHWSSSLAEAIATKGTL